MPGVILAVVERPEVAERMLSAAETLAELAGAVRINALAIRTPPVETIIVSEEVLTRQDKIRIRAEEQARADALKTVFDAWVPAALGAGIAAEWCEVEERADAAVAEWGRRADFVVLGRPLRHDPETHRQAMHAALFDSDRPVLVVPPERPSAPFGRRVAIAWRDDSRTIRSVLAALRWLARTQRIDVIAGAREGAPLPRLPDILADHGIEADLHVLPIRGHRLFGEALLEKAHELGADMLVLGAYAHHPLSTFILGGVTRHVLTHADLPVLMRH